MLATALAVELAVLHNYAWHVHWTWKDRPDRLSFRSLGRFHLGNGLISLCSNLVLMRIFTGGLGMAIGLTSVVNFLLGDRWVFADAST